MGIMTFFKICKYLNLQKKECFGTKKLKKALQKEEELLIKMKEMEIKISEKNNIEDSKKEIEQELGKLSAQLEYIKGSKECLISRDNYKIDTPVLDIVNLYKKEYLKMNFEEILARYMRDFPLLESERTLLFILIALPPKIEKENTEILRCREIEKKLDYVFKTENLLRPYYAKEEEKE